MLKDNEVKGIGNSLDFGARIYDSRIGRWLSLDPLARKYPAISPYAFAANNPIYYLDPDGKKIIPTQEFLSSSWGKVYLDVMSKNSVYREMVSRYKNSDVNDYYLMHDLDNYEMDKTTTHAYTDFGRNINGAEQAMSNFNKAVVNNSNLTTTGKAAVIIHEAVHAGYLGPKGEEQGIDHSNFAEKYRTKYHDALMEYNTDNGSKYSKEQIEMLSWQGLDKTEAFDKYISEKANKSGNSKDWEKHVWKHSVNEIMYESESKSNSSNTWESKPNSNDKVSGE